MLISCEKCKKVFEVNERHLNAQGVTAICPHCEHKHRVKRIVIPYSVDGEDDTEPYNLKDIQATSKSNIAYINENELSEDLEPIEAKSEVIIFAKEDKKNEFPEEEGGEESASSEIYSKNRRVGKRGTVLDRFVSVNFLYLLVASIVVLVYLIFLITK